MSLDKLFKELGGIVRFLQQAGDQGLEINRRGRLGEGSDDREAAVYDVQLRFGTLFGQGKDKQRPDTFATKPPATLEPTFDLFDESQEVVIVVQLPGVAASDVHLKMQGSDLILDAGNGERQFARQIHLPFAADLDQSSILFANGILEIRLPKQPV